MLLDCWSIPCVILLTWIFLKTRYKFKKFAGVAICIAGLVMVVFSDVHSSDRASKYFLPKGKMEVPFQSCTFPSDYFFVLIVSLNLSSFYNIPSNFSFSEFLYLERKNLPLFLIKLISFYPRGQQPN